MVGGPKIVELFGGDQRLLFGRTDYGRGESFLDRILAWVDLLGTVRDLTRGLRSEECLIVDPDSRLTQLGLLPVTGPGGYLFFPSREYGFSSDHSLARLTSEWLDEVFGACVQTQPSVCLAQTDREKAGAFFGSLRRGEHRPIASVNFGVGDNASKRVGDQFEKQLLKGLLETGFRIVLDRGVGEHEGGLASDLVKHIASIKPSVRILDVSETTLTGRSGDSGDEELITWSGRIGLFAALIGESDLYIGYDSAGQHIAAALGVPCIDVFAGYSSPRMLERWRPTGRAESRVIVVEREHMDEEAIAAEVAAHASELLGHVSRPGNRES